MGILKVMTFNVRLDVDKGANDFGLRKHRIAELINREKPDVVGFQEATNRMRYDLSENEGQLAHNKHLVLMPLILI